jgi:nucleotide-binding universal stress UspA family protein
MFTSILVPLDGSPESDVALPLARTIAHQTGAPITLLRVVPLPTWPGDRHELDAATDAIQRTAREMARSGAQVHGIARPGNVLDAILDQSRAQRADLIIMRTHARVGLGRVVLGSVTEHVVADSGVPVLLLRPGSRQPTNIRTLLVPVDGSPGGAVALGAAVGLAQATGAALKLLEVAVPIPLSVYTGYGFGGTFAIDPAWDEEALASARAYVDGIVTRLRGAGLVADSEARLAPDVAEAIVTVADQGSADLIVMSTQALIGPARALLGSVADAVVRGAHCPVLLVHRADVGAGPARPMTPPESRTISLESRFHASDGARVVRVPHQATACPP